MKRGILQLLFLLSVSSFCYAQPAISFNQVNYDFAAIMQEDQVEHDFEFTNRGDQELLIDKLQAS